MSSNPMLNSNVTENVILEGRPMSVAGAINKTAISSKYLRVRGLSL